MRCRKLAFVFASLILVVVLVVVVPRIYAAYVGPWRQGVTPATNAVKELIMPTKYARIKVYVIGRVLNKDVLGPESREVSRILGCPVELVPSSTLTAVPTRNSLIVLLRPPRPGPEARLLLKSMLKGIPLLAVGSDVKERVDSLISRYATVEASFNGTSTYLYVLVPPPLSNGRYVTLVKGYAASTRPGSLPDPAVIANALRTASRAITQYGGGVFRPYGIVGWNSSDKWYPHGMLVLRHVIYKYPGRIGSDKDLFAVRCVTQIISGQKLGLHDYPFVWWNDYIKSEYYLRYYTRIYDLIDYSPSSRGGGGTISVVISWPPVVTLSWNYDSTYITSIDDDSILGVKAGWYHDIGTPYSPAVPNTVKIEPGFEYTVSPPSSGAQRWVITAGWLGMGVNPGYPLQKFAGTVVIKVIIED